MSKEIDEIKKHRSKSVEIDQFLTGVENGSIVERWDDIEDYENLYQVSDFGNVRHVNGRSELLKPELTGSGYFRVSLCKDGVVKRFQLHRLEAKIFCENPNNKKFVNHKNGIKVFNYYKNLEWVTTGENNSHAYRTGLHLGSAFGKYLGDAHGAVPVNKFTREMIFVKNYSCVKEAGLDNGIDPRRVTECARGRKKTGGGFIWRYALKN